MRRDRARARRQTRGAFGQAGDRHRTIQGAAGGGETATPAGEEGAASDRSQAESHAIAGGAPSPGGRGHGGGGATGATAEGTRAGSPNQRPLSPQPGSPLLRLAPPCAAGDGLGPDRSE